MINWEGERITSESIDMEVATLLELHVPRPKDKEGRWMMSSP